MLNKIRLYLLAALALIALLFTACSDDSSSSSASHKSKNGVARYTAIIYGSDGGDMDQSIEGTMHDLQEILGDEDDVRVLLVYKYGGGKVFTGTLAYPGQMVYTEITKDTDLSTLKDSSAIVEDSVKLYDPEYITSVINYAHDKLPAQEYLLFIEGHGVGYDFESDFPKSERGKALAKQSAVSAVVPDAWFPFGEYMAEAITMPELAKGIKKSKISHFKAIVFNTCLTANMETLNDIYSYADYLLASEHTLLSMRGELMTEVVEALINDSKGNFEDVIKGVFENNDFKVSFRSGYFEDNSNGDYQFIKTDKFAELAPIFKKLAKRLIELYANEKNRAAIDKATDKTYKLSYDRTFYDALDYANKLAEETKDKTLKEIAKDLEKAFDAVTLTRSLESHVREEAPLDRFTFSIVLVGNETYNEELTALPGRTNRDTYEYSSFHKETGWGDWLNTNAHEPTNNPYGEGEPEEEDPEEESEDDAEEE